MTHTTKQEQQKAVLDKLLRSHKHLNGNGNGARLSDKVFDYVVESIREGRFALGSRITERAIARQLDISHVPVREAMEKLLQHGWVERVEQKGVYVKNFNQAEIEEIYQLREVIEGGAARFAAEKITPRQLEELHQVVELLESAYESNNAEVFKEADTQFHRLIVHFSGNKRLDGIFEAVVLQARCFFFVGASGTSLYARQAREHLEPVSHRLIYEAIAAHDSLRAEELIRNHIRTGCRMITELRNLLSLA
jgi:DNA-binding GntR family transcriptional regulator